MDINLKIAMISLGCPKNQVDADVMCHKLLLEGHTTTPHIEEADVIIVNTCGFIESAKQESINNILMACDQKNLDRKVKVIATGCLAERYREELANEIPELDAVVGIGKNKDICEIVNKIEAERLFVGKKSDLALGGKRIISSPAHFAYLKISEGCNNRCHFCAIPLIRGNLRCRDMQDILNEAKWMVSEGVKEIIVVAQDVTAYGDDKGENKSCELLYKLNAIEGVNWIRLLYAYPEKITEEFAQTLADCDKIVPYIDIPIQHINSEVLKNMNRNGDRETVINSINRLRSKIPDITIRSTLIVGFPGETEEQFEELCDFVREYKIDRLGCFAYSQEENTPASVMDNQIDPEIKQKRADIIMRIQSEVSEQKQNAKIGKTLTVICDDYDSEYDLYVCRPKSDAPDIDTVCYVKSEEVLTQGGFYNVLIEECDIYDLFGYIV